MACTLSQTTEIILINSRTFTSNYKGPLCQRSLCMCILYGFLTLGTAIQNGFTFVLLWPVNSLISNKNDNFFYIIKEETRIFATFDASNLSLQMPVTFWETRFESVR